MDTFDIVVVGGGSGGCAVAGRLSEGGRYSVCLLEAGGDNNNLPIKIPGMMPFLPKKSNWRYETVPQPGLNGRRGYQPRGRGLGGSSAINAMVYIRGHKWDYDNWAAMGATGWSYDDVLPYFIRAENNQRGASEYHGGNGPLIVSDQLFVNPGSHDFVEAAASLQIPRVDDFNQPSNEGVGIYQVTQRNGERWSAARAYVEPQRASGKLDVRTGAQVSHLGFDNGRANKVFYRQGSAQKVVHARRAIVLSGGVFGTAQTLMLSGIGPAEHLRSHGIDVLVDRQQVGKNLQDHIDYTLGYETGGDVFLGQNMATRIRVAKSVFEWFRSRTGQMTTPYAEAGGFARTRPDLEVPDVQFHFAPAVLEDHGRTKVKAVGFSCHVCVLRPESNGTVTLASSNPEAAPLIDPRFFSDDRDMQTMVAGVKLTKQILDSAPLTRHGGKIRYLDKMTKDSDLVELIRNRADTVYHPVGTARMGSDAEAVCDPELRVRGVEGLYIADASVMPKILTGNTNAPSMMIGERCSDFITKHDS